MSGATLLVDLILLLVVAEAVALTLFRRRTGRGPAPAAVLPTLAAGAALLVAVRLALSGAPLEWLMGALAVAGLAHIADLRARWTG